MCDLLQYFIHFPFCRDCQFKKAVFLLPTSLGFRAYYGILEFQLQSSARPDINICAKKYEHFETKYVQYLAGKCANNIFAASSLPVIMFNDVQAY